MTIMLEREADIDAEDFSMDIDDDAMGMDPEELDLIDLSDLMTDDCEDGEHIDAYTLETGSSTITQRCDSCGDTWTEYL